MRIANLIITNCANEDCFFVSRGETNEVMSRSTGDLDHDTVNRRNAIKTIAATSLGVAGIAGTASDATARPISPPEDDAGKKFGDATIEKFERGVASAKERQTQNFVLKYLGSKSPDANGDIPHEFKLLGYGNVRYKTEYTDWEVSPNAEINRHGFRVETLDGSAEITDIDNTRGMGIPYPEAEKQRDLVFAGALGLAGLVVGYYYPLAGLAVGGSDVAHSLTSIAGRDTSPDEPSKFSREWENSPLWNDLVDGNVFSDTCHYTYFKVNVPKETSPTLSFESYSGYGTAGIECKARETFEIPPRE